MHTISTTATHNDLMAQWLATGGAVEPTAAPAETAGDDGLSTAPHTFIVYCVEDDGLAALIPSMGLPCGADDGLSTAPHTFIVYCVEDSGLAAQGPSVQFPCRADDGLAAAQTNYYCRDAEGGLEALSVSRACVGAEGLKAGNSTNPWACR